MSEQTKHTPEPWEVSILGDGTTKIIGIYSGSDGQPNYRNVATIDGENAANAALIAAAPDLLAACKEALQCCHLIPGPGHEASLVGMLEAAIARAESRQPVEAK